VVDESARAEQGEGRQEDQFQAVDRAVHRLVLLLKRARLALPSAEIAARCVRAPTCNARRKRYAASDRFFRNAI